MKLTIEDDKGRSYGSIRKAMAANGVAENGRRSKKLLAQGVATFGGVTFRVVGGVAHSQEPAHDPTIDKLRARYTDAELKKIADGKGIERRYIPYPDIHLTGRHHRVLVMSDTHIGSVFSPKDEWHDIVAAYANDPDNGVECILHCGDLVEGMKVGRMGTQIYELSDIGYVAQRDEAVRLMSKYRPPIYIISGNHDRFFTENAGCDIVADVCERVPNMTKIGDDSADIDVDGCKIRLFHGGDGSSYAISYSLQKLVEAMNGGTKPNILIRGHIHKYCALFTRNVHAISCPAMQSQSNWMRGKRLEAHIGFLVLDFDVDGGQVCNLGITLYPFYA